MFERYTEKARRVIFFARYEASQYGSQHIGSEHILLGLFREDGALMRVALENRGTASEIRKEIEKGIQPRERIPTSVDVPLNQESVRILRFAADEASQLNRGYVRPAHLLLGLLMTAESLAAQILTKRGVQLAAIRQLAESSPGIDQAKLDEASAAIQSFLAAIGWAIGSDLASFFAADAQFVDPTGKRWKGREEIVGQFEDPLLPYAKKDVTSILESVDQAAADIFTASVLWENVTVSGRSTRSMQRMTIIVEDKNRHWEVLFIQVTPVQVAG